MLSLYLIRYHFVGWCLHLKKIQTKQNHSARLMFLATLYGETTESAVPLVNLQEFHTVENIFKLQILHFSHKWHEKQPGAPLRYFTDGGGRGW